MGPGINIKPLLIFLREVSVWSLMPVVYRCTKCGAIIYTFLRAGQDYYGVPSPSELIVRIASTCPSCGKILEKMVDISRIEIKIFK